MALCSGCGRIAFNSQVDGAALDTSATPVCHSGTFASPVDLTAVNSTTVDWAPSLSADGRQLYFSSYRSGIEEIYVAQFDEASGWLAPTLISEIVTGSGEEGNPSISSDNLELYWGQTALYRSTRPSTSAAWTVPAEMILGDGPALTLAEGPEISDDGQTLYFSAQRQGATERSLWTTLRMGAAFEPPQRIAELDTSVTEGWPTISSDELELFYNAYDFPGGSTDLYHATRSTRADAWITQGPLTELNIPNVFDEDADLSVDGRTLVYASRRAGGQGDFDLWITTRSCD